MDQMIVYPELNMPDLLSNSGLLQSLPMLVRYRHCKLKSSLHWHDYLQIFYTVSGSYTHTVNSVTYKQTPGSVVLVFPYSQHGIDTSQSDISQLEIVQISVRTDMFTQYCVPFSLCSFNHAHFDSRRLSPSLQFFGKKKLSLDHICADIVAEYQKKKLMQPNKLMGLLADFLEICAERSDVSISPRDSRTILVRNQSVEAAMDYMQKNSMKQIYLNDISNAAMMSISRFSDCFSTVVGKTPHAYLSILRIKHAIHMLQKTTKPISQIAQEAGFYDVSHFRQKCIESCGTSPSVLRKDLSQWTRSYGDMLYQDAIKDMRWTGLFNEDGMQRHRCAMSFY